MIWQRMANPADSSEVWTALACVPASCISSSRIVGAGGIAQIFSGILAHLCENLVGAKQDLGHDDSRDRVLRSAGHSDHTMRFRPDAIREIH
jgi:hypothetical protein